MAQYIETVPYCIYFPFSFSFSFPFQIHFPIGFVAADEICNVLLKNIAVQSGIQYVLLNWCLNRSIFHLKHFCSFIVMVCQFSSWQTWICYIRKIVVMWNEDKRIHIFTQNRLVFFISSLLSVTNVIVCMSKCARYWFVCRNCLENKQKMSPFCTSRPNCTECDLFWWLWRKNWHINFLSFTLGFKCLKIIRAPGLLHTIHYIIRAPGFGLLCTVCNENCCTSKVKNKLFQIPTNFVVLIELSAKHY